MAFIETATGPRRVTTTGIAARAQAFDEIPLIDFGPMFDGTPDEKRRVAAMIKAAAGQIGFFYIENHGVPAATIARLFAEAPAFFGLPLAEKMKVHVGVTGDKSGYTPLLEENTDPTAKGDMHEAFDIAGGGFLAEGAAPAETTWPPEAAGFRAAMADYQDEMLRLGRRLFAAVALALGQDEDFFAPYITRPTALQRVVYYPPQDPAALSEDQIGIGAHSDYECFTILAQHEVPALQVLNPAGEWIAAPPIPGTFVVNIADQLARWSNDVFASTIHRAINVTGRPRYSAPFFLGTNYDTLIDVLPGCATPDRPRKYAPVMAGEYVESRFDATYGYRKAEPGQPPSEGQP